MNQIEKGWDELRNRCCADPTKAKRCVMVSRDDFAAAIAAMQPAPQWKWIGSAPRNGTCVLLWIPADDGRHAYIASGWYESGVFDNRWYAAMDENPLSPQPTHWMPLPTPPAGGSDAE